MTLHLPLWLLYMAAGHFCICVGQPAYAHLMHPPSWVGLRHEASLYGQPGPSQSQGCHSWWALLCLAVFTWGLPCTLKCLPLHSAPTGACCTHVHPVTVDQAWRALSVGYCSVIRDAAVAALLSE